MMTLEEIRNKLEDRNLALVAKYTGVSYRTVYDIKTGKNNNPSYQSVRLLANYLELNK